MYEKKKNKIKIQIALFLPAQRVLYDEMNKTKLNFFFCPLLKTDKSLEEKPEIHHPAGVV